MNVGFRKIDVSNPSVLGQCRLDVDTPEVNVSKPPDVGTIVDRVRKEWW